MRINYSLDIEKAERQRHWQHMKEFYQSTIASLDAFDGKLHDGFYLNVENVGQAREVALADKYCGHFFTFEAADLDTGTDRTMLDGDHIGEVTAFSELTEDSGIRRAFLTVMSGCTHMCVSRGDKQPSYFGEGRKGDSCKIYSPSGDLLWPVANDVIEHESALVSAAREEASPTTP